MMLSFSIIRKMKVQLLMVNSKFKTAVKGN